jgi:hypothetical protein
MQSVECEWVFCKLVNCQLLPNLDRLHYEAHDRTFGASCIRNSSFDFAS